MKPSCLSPALLAALMLPGAVWAAGCNLASTGINFGLYDVFDPQPRDSTATVTLTCHEPVLRNLRVNLGPSSVSGAIAQRELAGPRDRLAYNLFADSARAQVWGDDTGGGSGVTVSGVSRDTPRRVVIYGRIPAGQNVSVGEYSDILLITIAP